VTETTIPGCTGRAVW